MKKNLIMAWNQKNASNHDTVNKIVVWLGNKKYFFDTQKEHILESMSYKPLAVVENDNGLKIVKLSKRWSRNSTQIKFIRYFLLDEANIDVKSTKDLKELIKQGKIELVDEITE